MLREHAHTRGKALITSTCLWSTGPGGGDAPPWYTQLGTIATSSERSHRHSCCGKMSVRLSTRAIPSASRSACVWRDISSWLARMRSERFIASVHIMSPKRFGGRPWFGSSPPQTAGVVPATYSPSPSLHGMGSGGAFSGT